MTEKRYFLHKHLGRDAIHDTICHNWLQREELEEHMNVQYTKYSTLKKENEQLKEDMVFHLQEIGSKHEIEKMEKKYNFNYSEELYKADTKQRIKMGLEPLRRDYYD